MNKSIIVLFLVFSCFSQASIEKELYIYGGITNGTCDTQVVIEGKAKDDINLDNISIYNDKVVSNRSEQVYSVGFYLVPVDGSYCPKELFYFNLTGKNQKKSLFGLKSNSNMNIDISFKKISKEFKNQYDKKENFDYLIKKISLRSDFFSISSIVDAGKVKATIIYQISYL